jgi:hypothetical protein
LVRQLEGCPLDFLKKREMQWALPILQMIEILKASQHLYKLSNNRCYLQRKLYGKISYSKHTMHI